MKLFTTIIFFLVWGYSATWNLLQSWSLSIPYLLGPADIAWRCQLLSGNIFFALHSLDSRGPKRTLLFFFWSFIWAFIFESIGIPCYEPLGCPFGKYSFTEPVLSVAESFKIGVVPFTVLLSWFTWSYLIFHLSNTVVYGSLFPSYLEQKNIKENQKSFPFSSTRSFMIHLLKISFLDGILNSLRASVTDAIYSHGIGATPSMIIFELKDHFLFLDVPIRNFLMWIPAGFLISFFFRISEIYLLNKEKNIEVIKKNENGNQIQKQKLKFLDFIFVFFILFGFPVMFMLSFDLPSNYRIASFVNIGIPTLIGVSHWIKKNMMQNVNNEKQK